MKNNSTKNKQVCKALVSPGQSMLSNADVLSWNQCCYLLRYVHI